MPERRWRDVPALVKSVALTLMLTAALVLVLAVFRSTPERAGHMLTCAGLWISLLLVVLMDLYPMAPWAADVPSLRRPISRAASLLVALVFVFGWPAVLLMPLVGATYLLIVERRRAWRVAVNVSFAVIQAGAVAGLLGWIAGTDNGPWWPSSQPTAAGVLVLSALASLVWVVVNALVSSWMLAVSTDRTLVAALVAVFVDTRFWLVSFALTPVLVWLLLTAPLLLPLVGLLIAVMWQALVVAGRLNRQARTDALTGLANRSALLADLDDLLARHGVVLLFADIDLFKQVNDTHGHPTGDRVLAELGRRIRRCTAEHRELRAPTDTFAARFGGDEFVVLLAERCTDRQVEEFATRLSAVVARPMTLGELVLAVECSYGWHRSGPSGQPMDVLRAADRELYRRKHLRRDGGDPGPSRPAAAS